MKVVLKRGSTEEQNLQTLVVFAFASDTKKALSLPKSISALSASIQDAKNDGAFSAKSKDTLFFRNANLHGAQHVLVVGLGDPKDLNNETLRVGGATAYHALKANKAHSAAADMDSLLKGSRDQGSALQAAIEGFLLASYEFDEHKTVDKKKKSESLNELVLVSPRINKSHQTALHNATILSEYTNFGRWLGDQPGNMMTPDILAKTTQDKAKGSKVKVTVWNKARIEKEGFGGLLGVSLGSTQEPRFIILEYSGAAKSKKPVYFVGKGLTFDSGGISIKPSQSMDEMKYDMCGGANVIAAVLAMAKLKLKVNVVGLVPASENMPGPNANKPGDIFTARNGKTVEVLNTDAEGRLILADALSYASEFKPQAIFDAATLTGAIVVALGNSYTGVFSRDTKLVKRIQAAADAVGEQVWSMPLADCHVEDIKGLHADLSNISSFKGAGSSTAAGFLEQFVEKGIPYAHFDIAGTAWNINNRVSYAPKKGASGVMVRTFVELAKSYF